MKCEHCPALRTEGYEYPESYCLLGAESTREYADGWSGCYRKMESIKKQVAKIEEMMDHQYDGIDEFAVKEDLQEQAMRTAWEQTIRKTRWGDTLYLCFKNKEGNLYPYGSDTGEGNATQEQLGMLRLVFLEEVRRLEREAYHNEVPGKAKAAKKRRGGR